jgi:ubiquinone biosynthesis protein UbiJ
MDDAIVELIKAEFREVHTQLTANSISLGTIRNMLSTLNQDVRMVRAAINDMERTRFSAGEAAAIHEDLNRLMARVEALEAR